jgi:hypothetical protein
MDEFEKINYPFLSRGPKRVYIEQCDQFDPVEHKDCILIFPFGYFMKDREWQLQYNHNQPVMSKYMGLQVSHQRTFVRISAKMLNDGLVDNISILCKGVLFERIWIENIQMEYMIMKPYLRPDPPYIDITLKMTTMNKDIDLMVVYKDGRTEPMPVGLSDY